MQERTSWREDADRLPNFAPRFEYEVEKTALMIVDMQYSYTHPDYGISSFLKKHYPEIADYFFKRVDRIVLPNQIKLIDFFRDNGLRIIYVMLGAMLPDFSDFLPIGRKKEEQGIDKPPRYKSIWPVAGSFEYKIREEIEPRQGEVIINKTSSGLFNSTAADRLLSNMGIDYLVIAGVVTHACVEATARDAADRGYKCVLVEDACASYAQEWHDAALRVCYRCYGKVQNTSEVIADLTSRC